MHLKVILTSSYNIYGCTSPVHTCPKKPLTVGKKKNGLVKNSWNHASNANRTYEVFHTIALENRSFLSGNINQGPQQTCTPFRTLYGFDFDRVHTVRHARTWSITDPCRRSTLERKLRRNMEGSLQTFAFFLLKECWRQNAVK